VTEPLRLLVFDATQKRRRPKLLGFSWQYGAHLYRGLGRIDAAHGALSFASALDWLAQYEPARQIQELQFWGHGRWGRALIDGESFDRNSLAPGHALARRLQALGERLVPNALVWFRTCETLGAQAGHDFASALGDATGARVAGHTFVIGFFQSGLHCLRPGQSPSWSVSEGLADGTPDAPRRAHVSGPDAPNTITCLNGQIPEGFR